jgi:serine/threonine protein kinase
VALKQITGGTELQYQREVLIAACFSHPTLLSVIGCTPFSRDPPIILVPLMETGSLQAVIEQVRADNAPAWWNFTAKMIILFGAAVGVWTLHKSRVIHRDLKPGNILLDGNHEPKLSDFGASKVSPTGASAKNSIGNFGTPSYLGPEAIEGESYGFPADVFAFGMTMYAVLSGQDPFSGRNAFQVQLGIMNGDRPVFPPDTPSRLAALAAKCWDQNPSQRPAFSEIVAELENSEFLDSIPLLASWTYREYRGRIRASQPDPLPAARVDGPLKVPTERPRQSAEGSSAQRGATPSKVPAESPRRSAEASSSPRGDTASKVPAESPRPSGEGSRPPAAKPPEIAPEKRSPPQSDPSAPQPTAPPRGLARFCRREEFQNALTDKLAKSQMASVKDFLCDPDISAVTRNDPKSVAVWLNEFDANRGQDQNAKRLHTLVEWALTVKWNTWEIDDEYKLRQINRNAATFCSAPTRNVCALTTADSYVIATVKGFIRGPLARDPVFAGNFQRIIEAFWRYKAAALEEKAFVFELADFAIRNIDVLAYHDLVSRFSVDFPDMAAKCTAHWGDPSFVFHILKVAANHIFECEPLRSKNFAPEATTTARFLDTVVRAIEPLPDSGAPGLFVAMFLAHKSKQVDPSKPMFHAPLTVEHEEYGIPVDLLRELSHRGVLAGGRAYASRLKKRKAQFHYSDSAEREMGYQEHHLHAHLLLTVIEQIGAEMGDVYEGLRPAASDYESSHSSAPMELLLICGIYSDPRSLVAKTAFKLLDIIVYGKLVAPVLEMDSIFFDREVQTVLDDYAQDFQFSQNLTPQMSSAFSLFWNHRYPDLRDDELKMAVNYPPVEVRWMTPDGSEGRAISQYPRGPGLTPLEFYGALMLWELPILDSLNRQILRILEMVVVDAVKLAHPEPEIDFYGMSPEEYIQYQKKPTERALILVEFLRTRFLHSGVAGIQPCATDMRILKRVIPLIPIDRSYVAQPEQRHRPLVNGSILKIAKLLTDFERDPFCLACEPGPLANFIMDYGDEQFIARIHGYRHLAAQFRAGAVRLLPREDLNGE